LKQDNREAFHKGPPRGHRQVTIESPACINVGPVVRRNDV
jgi:hypothetical protein